MNRTTKRREKIHQDILEVAAQLIEERGSSGVTLEEISLKADVARKTVYNHFDNKAALIEELVLPVCNHARTYLSRMGTQNALTLDHIWDYCLEIWDTKAFNVGLLYQISSDDYKGINESKHGFVIVFYKLLKQIEGYNKLEDIRIKEFAEIIYETYMPLLKCLNDAPNYETKFRHGMSGLLNGISKTSD